MSFLVLKASAGSGKTTQLTLHLLAYLLENPEGYRQVLASTFTRKATKELRERVIQYLKDLAFQRGEGFLYQHLGITDKQAMATRAKACLDNIFTHWGLFRLQTIDSFVTHLGTASAEELGISLAQEMVFDPKPFEERVMEELIQEASPQNPEGRILQEALKNYWNVNVTMGWNIQRILTERVDKFFQFWFNHRVDGNPPAVQIPLEELQETFTQTLKNLGKAILPLKDHLHKGKILSKAWQDTPPYVNLTIEDWENSYNKTPEDFFRKSALPLPREIHEHFQTLRELYQAYVLEKSIQDALPAYALKDLVLKRMEKLLKQERGVLLAILTQKLADFLMTHEPVVTQIYYYLGEQLKSYFIDEFQDTSPLQWEAIKALTENALANGGTFVMVGDIKQSIYRFRGADWRLMQEVPQRWQHFEPHQRRMEENFRSGSAIVSFTNQVFHPDHLKEWLEAIHKKVPLAKQAKQDLAITFEDSQQKAHRKVPGYLYLEEIPLEKRFKAEQMEITLNRILQVFLPEILTRFKPQQVTFLCRTNEEVAFVTRKLLDHQYAVASRKTLHLTSSLLIQELIALGRWVYLQDSFGLANFLLGTIMEKKEPEGVKKFRQWMEKHPGHSKAFLKNLTDLTWGKVLLELIDKGVYLPPFDFYSQMIHTFKLWEDHLEEQAFLGAFLDAVGALEEETLASWEDFFQGFEDEELLIPAPEVPGALQVLTIHGAKGLGFDVVICPFLYIKKPQENWVVVSKNGKRVLAYTTKNRAEAHPLLSQAYQEEIWQSLQEELHLHYVMFTRAKEEFYGFFPFQDNRTLPSPALDYLEKGVLERGEKSPSASKSPPSFKVLSPPPEKREPWEKLLLKKVEPFVFHPENYQEATERGIRYHQILARCLTKEDFVKTADPLLTPIINDLPAFFFDTQTYTIYREKGVLDLKGNLYILDRLGIGPSDGWVLDWKYAHPSAHHQTQVKTYADLIHQMVGKSIKAYLYYLQEKLFVEVV